MTSLGAAYSAGAEWWERGPSRVYDTLAQLLVAFSPVPFSGRSVLDLGSGTGTGSRAATAAGARVVAADLAFGMLLVGRETRPPATVADARALPFRRGALDVVLAPFALNHLNDPATGVREAGRVADVLVASTYAADDDHPVKAAVETALGEAGWTRPAWYDELKASMAAWGTVELATSVVQRGGMVPLSVEYRAVTFPELGPTDMVAWRMGLPNAAPFVDSLGAGDRRRCAERAVELLGPDPEPVVRRVIFLAASAPGR